MFSSRSFSDYLTAPKRREYAKKMVEQEMAYCRSSLAMALLKDNELGQIEEIWPQAKNDFLNTVFASYSHTSRETFEQYLSNLKIVPISSNKNAKNISDILAKVTRGEPTHFTIPEIIDYLSNYLINQNYSSKTQHTYCTNYLKMDTAYLDKFQDTIYLSRLSCTHYHYGKSSLLHELTHALSMQFYLDRLSEKSNEQFKELRSCVKSFYSKTTINTHFMAHPGDTKTVEEDMADIVSYWVNPDPTFLSGCSYLKPTYDGSSYDHLKLGLPLSTDMFVQNSPDMVRILIEAVHKGRVLPLSCQKLLDKYDDHIQLSRCF